jgi:acetyltransferase-like isoleucine patch superfamily enzyme
MSIGTRVIVMPVLHPVVIAERAVVATRSVVFQPRPQSGITMTSSG